jgi:hypothetical protein
MRRKYRPSTDFFLQLPAVFVCLLTGCATKPIAYVGLYGEYREELPVVAKILRQYELELRRLDVDPPVGIRSSAVIHGNGKAATRTANDIAYSLYKTFGTWVTVRPVTIANHSYSSDFIGIYLLSPEYFAEVGQAEEAELSVVATSSYEAQACDNFAVVLSLEPAKYKVLGTQFDEKDTESPISIEGSYTVDEGGLALEYLGSLVRFRREQVQHSSQEPIKREKYIPIRTASTATEVESVFSCSFLQELDVVARQ